MKERSMECKSKGKEEGKRGINEDLGLPALLCLAVPPGPAPPLGSCTRGQQLSQAPSPILIGSCADSEESRKAKRQ